MKTYRIATAAIAVLASAIGRADIAYNNFGSGDSYDANHFYELGGDDDLSLAMSFVSGTAGSVTLVKLALLGSNLYNISIDADANGLPGTRIETWNASGSDSNYLSVIGDGSANLAAGTRYWVEVAAYYGQGENGLWYLSNFASGLAAQSSVDGSWVPFDDRLCAFRVETAAVPEPGGVAAVALGAIGLLVRRRKPV